MGTTKKIAVAAAAAAAAGDPDADAEQQQHVKEISRFSAHVHMQDRHTLHSGSRGAKKLFYYLNISTKFF